MKDNKCGENRYNPLTRRKFIKTAAAGAATLAIPVGTSDASVWDAFLQKHFREMSRAELAKVVERLKKEYADKYNTSFNIKTTEALPNTLFGYGLDLSRCIGCRRCVYACVRENNQSRDPQIHYITVLQFTKGEKWVSDLEKADKYYYPEKVPAEGHFYMPVSCQQCENPGPTGRGPLYSGRRGAGCRTGPPALTLPDSHLCGPGP